MSLVWVGYGTFLSVFYSRPLQTTVCRKAVMFCACFSSFLFNESPQKRPNAVWRQIWQNVGPGWAGCVRKFYRYPPRGFSRGSEKLSKKYAFRDSSPGPVLSIFFLFFFIIRYSHW